jgi:exonuclease SbcC
MKIESVELENIRSHTKTHINFSDGFNCLVGGLGTGKSSILYAIDFALFGEPIGRSYDYLLREDADFGKVTVKFLKNGKEYVIQRALRRQNDRISQDMEQLKFLEEDKVTAEMKGEAVAEQLFSVTGFDKEIFREIVWIRQEHLKDVLNMTPTERQKRLDQLFGLSDYEVAWTNLRPVIAGLEKESGILQIDADVVGIGELTSRRNDATKEFETNENELTETKTKLLEAEKGVQQTLERLKSLETVRRTNEQLHREESSLQAKLSGVQQSSNRLNEEIERRTKRVDESQKRLANLNLQMDSFIEKLREVGLPPKLTVEQLLDYKQTLKGEIKGNLGREESLKGEISRSTQRITNLVKENTCPLCLQVLSPEYKESLMQRLYKEVSDNKQQLVSLENITEKHENVQNIVETIVQNFQTTQTRTEEISGQIEDEKKSLVDAQNRLEQSRNDEKTIDDELKSLRSKIKEFEISELEKAQEENKAAYEMLSDLKHKAQINETNKLEILKRLQTLEERLKNAQQKMSRFEKVKKVVSLALEIRQSYRSIQPRIRGEFIRYLERVVQQFLDELSGAEGMVVSVKIDEDYTPVIEGEKGVERSSLNLSGGERTLLAFAYRLGLGQLIMQWRVGHGLPMLFLDEPTESLGREDGSIDRLAESLSQLKTVEQIIAVTHSEAFAEKADHVVRLEKHENRSVMAIER